MPRCYDALETKPQRNAVVVAMRSWLSCLVISQCGDVISIGLQGYRRMSFSSTGHSSRLELQLQEKSILFYRHSFQENWGNTSQRKAEPCVCNTIHVHSCIFLSLNFLIVT